MKNFSSVTTHIEHVSFALFCSSASTLCTNTKGNTHALEHRFIFLRLTYAFLHALQMKHVETVYKNDDCVTLFIVQFSLENRFTMPNAAVLRTVD